VVRSYWWFEDGSRVHVRGEMRAFDEKGAHVPSWGDLEFESLGTEGRFLLYQSSENRPVVSLTDDRADAEARSRQLRFDQLSGAALNGDIFIGAGTDENILVLARSGTPALAGNQVVDGTPCGVVASHTPNGDLKIWIAPEKGYTIIRFELRRGALPEEFRDRHGQPFRSFSSVFDQAKVRTIEGRQILVGGRVTNVLVQSDGSEVTETYILERETVDLSPDFASYHAFETTDIPDGIEARYFGRPGPMRYVWKSGKALPYYDPNLLSGIEQSVQSTKQPAGNAPAPDEGGTVAAAKEPPPSSIGSAATFALSAAAVVALLGIGLYVWRRQASKQGR
jgi:hypothetical protein